MLAAEPRTDYRATVAAYHKVYLISAQAEEVTPSLIAEAEPRVTCRGAASACPSQAATPGMVLTIGSLFLKVSSGRLGFSFTQGNIQPTIGIDDAPLHSGGDEGLHTSEKIQSR